MKNNSDKLMIMLAGIALFVALAALLFPKCKITPTHETSKKKMDRVYESITGFKISQQEKDDLKKTGAAPTYGEIPFNSLQTILDDLKLTDQDVFYDLGSGVGKTVVQVALTTPAKKIVGIELSPTRNMRVRKVMIVLERENIIPANKEFALEAGNFLDADLNDATIIYMCSTCYSPELMQSIVDKLSAIPGENKLRIVTLKKLPDNNAFKLIKDYRLPMTWSKKKGSPVFIYKRIT